MILQYKLRKKFFDSSISFYTKDKQGKYLEVNQAFLTQPYVENYKGRVWNEIVGRKDLDLWQGNAPWFHINDQKVILRQQSGSYIEDIIDQNKKYYYMSFKNPLLSRTGKVIGICGISLLLNSNRAIEDKQLSDDLIEIVQHLQYTRFNTQQNNQALTTRQKECLHYLARGMTIKEIGSELKLSARTIEHYLETIKIKLHCSSRIELIEKAFEYGLI